LLAQPDAKRLISPDVLSFDSEKLQGKGQQQDAQQRDMQNSP
jgi:hypothetical protein